MNLLAQDLPAPEPSTNAIQETPLPGTDSLIAHDKKSSTLAFSR